LGCGDPATSSPSTTWLVTPAPVVPELVIRLARVGLISWRSDAGYSRGTETAVIQADPEGCEDGHPRGAQRWERGRAVADRVPIFSLFGAEVISSVGNNITTLAVP
jgi:hypothetical protein